MKILMVAPQPFYTERGTPMNIRLMCRVLAESGHSVDLVVFPTGKDINISNVKIFKVPNLLGVHTIPIGFSLRKLFFDFMMMPGLMFFCIKNRYDAVHGIEEGGFMAVLLGRVFKIPIIFDMDSSISDQLCSFRSVKSTFLADWFVWLEKKALSSSNLIITVCTALTEKAKLLSPHSTIVQIEDIPIQNEGVLSHEEKGHIKNLMQQYDIVKNRYVLYTGNLEQYQGIDLLLDAWVVALSHLKPDAGDLKLVIIGGPPDKIEKYKTELHEKDHAARVVFTGPRPTKEMDFWMSRSTLLVSPRSSGENTPLKIFTYMASLRPLLATKRRTHTQVLDNLSAFLAEPDAASFGEMMAWIVKHPEQGEKKAVHARSVIDRKYTYQEFKRKLLEAYTLLSQKS